MKKTIVWAMSLMLSFFLFSQDNVREATNVQMLRSLEKQYRASFDMGHKQAVRLARKRGWPIRSYLPDKPAFELQFISRGMPQYYTTANLNAAIAASVDQIWPGGVSGLNLTGAGMIVGEWDAGRVVLAPEHVEYVGRATQVDAAASSHYHSVHVAGTLVATGIDPKARGMAYQAHLNAYDWNSDKSEMANAASTGLLLSNHSYGFTRGWYYSTSGWMWFGDVSVSATEDYLFGFYNSNSRAWDNIAYAAPYYLIVKAAGNDRSDVGGQPHLYFNGSRWVSSNAPRDPDGNYDCLGTLAVAKNILTVGAVRDDGQTMLGFSSWGPTDDGRIKPDICANGYALYSSSDSSSTSYMTLSGTSMASPSACGSLLLLQQHYRDVFGHFCRAATLKALILHSANDIGPVGPDYQCGWGMLNCARAAQIISLPGQNLLGEYTLNNGGTYTINITLDHTSSIRATICWTDPPATPPAPAVDPPDKMLVNDLDLRITNNSSVYFPWVLNPAIPSALATTGDNNTDNVEQVIIASAAPGSYTITISHKGNLAGATQDFSLILNGNFVPFAPSNLTADSYKAQVKLVWQDNSTDETGFEVQRNSDAGFSTIAKLKADATSYTDQVRLRSSHTYRVRAFNDSSYSYFSNQASVTAGSDSDTKCGVLGIEFLVFFLLLAFARRKRIVCKR